MVRLGHGAPETLVSAGGLPPPGTAPVGTLLDGLRFLAVFSGFTGACPTKN